MRPLLAALALVATALAVLPSAAGAARIYAVSDTELVWFDSQAPSIQVGSVTLTGIASDQGVQGLDWRPSNSTFLLLTKDLSNNGYLYDLDPTTGEAENVRPLDVALSGGNLGFDVDPVNDLVRIVSSADQNLSVDPDNGDATTETALTPAGEQVAAAAYTNVDNDPSTSSLLFDYGYDDNELFVQGPPESGGTLSFVGASNLAADTTPDLLHMDIAPDGEAFVTFPNAGSQRLLDLNRGIGKSENLGPTVLDPIYGMTAVNNVVSFTTTGLHVPESIGTIALVLVRAAAFDSPSVHAIVTVDTHSDTATAADFTGVLTNLQFAEGAAAGIVEIPVTDDALDEGDEFFTVTVEPGSNTPVGQLDVTGITIHDDDPETVTETKTETKTETITQTVTVDRPVGPAPVTLLTGRCANVRTGTVADDALAGTTAGDRITGLAGADGLAGLAGDDCLSGGPGGDLLSGAAGADELLGEGGDDVLLGGSENDTITAGGGLNRIVAGSGADTINARNRKRDVVDCGPGQDTIIADRRDRLRRCERVTRRR